VHQAAKPIEGSIKVASHTFAFYVSLRVQTFSPPEAAAPEDGRLKE
jgi:hypothetical protein